MAHESTARRAPSRRPGNGLWLGVTLIAGGALAVCIYAPDIPRRLLGSPTVPALGSEPALAQNTQGSLEQRPQETANLLVQPSALVRTAVPVEQAAPIAAPVKVARTYADEAKAAPLLVEAEKAYVAAPSAKDWSKAQSQARLVAGLDCTPATKVRAQDIVRGCKLMEELFRTLDDRDELSRNYETHPSLVMLVANGTSSEAVPIRSMDDPTVVDGDPLVWIQNQRRTGKVFVLLRGKRDFIPASLPSDQVGTVEKADVPKIITQKRTEFEAKLARLKNGTLARDPMAWYDAAKFAYQNRLDDAVAGLIDRALILDPLLGATVREDKAAGLFATLVLYLENGKVQSAAPFMTALDKRFADTPSGIQARALYDARTKQNADEVAAAQERLQKARSAARQNAAEESRKRREAKINRAKELGDETALREAESDEGAGDDASSIAAVSGDEGKADELYAKGRELYQKAQEAGNTGARDDLYGEANKFLTQAQGLYNGLLEKDQNNAVLNDKAFMCNKLRYGSIKQRRFH